MFFDASKAFDKINHWFLLPKLIARNIPIIIVRFLLTWYTSQTFLVRWNNVLSQSFTVTNGVRQGGISPILFNVLMDDLSHNLNSVDAGCCINGTNLNHLLYADDSVLLAPSAESLQLLLNKCEEYANKSEITYNPKKTVCMLIRPKWLKDLQTPSVTLNDKVLDFVEDHSYLGVRFSDQLSDDLDIKKQMKSIYARGNTLIRQFRHCNDSVKLKLFKSYCSSIYASSLWYRYSASVYKKIKGAYSNVFRHLMRITDRSIATSTIMVQHRIDTFTVILRKLVFSLRSRLLTSDNVLIKTVIGCQFFYFSPIYKHWEKVLGMM